MPVLFQFMGGGNDWTSWVFFMIFWGIFFFFYPRLMLSQIMWKLERTTEQLESMSARAKRFVTHEIDKNPDKKLNDSVERFFEFFVITPASLDPYGIVKKMELIVQNEKQRFDYFVDQVAPKMDKEKKANIEMGLAGGMELHMLAKIVRHYVELIKQTKSYQIALIIQMQLPLVERMAKALYEGTESLARGEPVGDGLGPLVAAKMMGKANTREIAEDVSMATMKVEGRTCYIMKSTGPGGRLGRPGKAVEKVVSRNKIARIITIDAAAKLEGEKTGSIAEGVGVAMGGPGVEKSFIEDVAVKHGIPLDSIIVKMKPEEAIMPMRKAIKDAVPEAINTVKEAVRRAKPNQHVIIVGVGNTSGVGQGPKVFDQVSAWVEKNEKKLKRKKKKGEEV